MAIACQGTWSCVYFRETLPRLRELLLIQRHKAEKAQRRAMTAAMAPDG